MPQHTSPSVSPPINANAPASAGLTASRPGGAPDIQSGPASDGGPVVIDKIGLRTRHRRLARYLYAAPLVRIRRVLDIGGDAEGGALLSQHGARTVLVLHTGGEGTDRSSALKPGDGVSLRSVSRAELARPGSLRAQTGGSDFDVVFLNATPELFTPTFLNELRSLLTKDGHLVVSARSREAADKGHAQDTIGYFDLLDNLTQAGFGPVSMLGQSAFLGSAVMPYGATEPQLVFDDTLSPPDGADEYLALCGAVPGGGLPYQIIKLPSQALDVSGLARPAERKTADPEVAAERDRLKSKLDALRVESEAQKSELSAARTQARGLEERLQSATGEAETRRNEATALRQKLDEQVAQLRAAEAQRTELSERLRQRDRSDAEAAKAATLHERQMRELRTALEERDAFVAELEDQTRDVPRLHEKLASADRLVEESQRRERQARQRLAELEGQLLRARGELAQIAGQTQLSAELEVRQREIEAARRELLMQRDAIEHAEQALATEKSALSRAEQTLASERAEMSKLRSDRAAAERAVADRDAALAEVRKELLVAQERLQQMHAELEQRNHALAQAGRAASPMADADGIPVLVGDMPTAPLSMHARPAAMGAAAEGDATQLRQRVTELSAENERLKDKLSDAERETWKHMKARSEAEAAAAEVREDTVRKLRDARKLASVELTRAMEDATKKAVQLREELARTEAERREAAAQAKELRGERDAARDQVVALKQEIETLRWTGSAAAGGAGTAAATSEELTRVRAESERALAQLAGERAGRQAAQKSAEDAQAQVNELRRTVASLEGSVSELREQAVREARRADALDEELQKAGASGSAGGVLSSSLQVQQQQELQQRERMLAERTAERDALGRLLAEVEREAAARAERARTLRVRLSEREREVEVLRAELLDRDRKLTAAEQQSPPSEELSRMGSELQAARRRVSELLDEASRRDQHGDDAVATALRERARAVRMGEALDQATRERDEAKSRSSDLEQRLTDAISESERLRNELLRMGSVVPDLKL